MQKFWGTVSLSGVEGCGSDFVPSVLCVCIFLYKKD